MVEPRRPLEVVVHKRGDTFDKVCTYKRAGVAFDLTGTAIVATIKDANGDVVDSLVATLLTQSGATLGQFSLVRAYASTATWPVGTHRFDIQYTFGDGKRITTRTLALRVVEDYS